MLRKILLTLCLFFTCFSVMAADYSKYSKAQLQQEYNRLIKIHSQDLANYYDFVEAMKEDFAEEQMPYSNFIKYLSGVYLDTINKNYTISDNTYRHDPRVDSFSDLVEVCAYITYLDDNPSTDCIHLATIYAFADCNRDTLKTLILLGTMLAIDIKDANQLTAKERRMLAFNADYKKYNLGFNLRAPTDYESYKDSYKQAIYAFFKIHIVFED